MTTDPKQSHGGTTIPIVEDLFLTDSFIIKGRIANKYQRLTKMLEDSERTFIEVEQATMVSLRGTEVIDAPKVLVNRSEIILAHEFVDGASDGSMRQLASNDKTARVRAFYSGAVQLELAGKIEPKAYEPAHNSGRWYFIMQEPSIRGINLEANEHLAVLKSLNYAIVRKSKLAYIYDFS